MGQLTAIVIAFALIADFILLPAFLLVIDGKKKKKKVAVVEVTTEEVPVTA